MRDGLQSLTRRGRWLVGLGAGTFTVSLGLGQRDLMRIGVLLLVLPVLSALLLVRTRYRLSCARGLRPTRVPVDGTATSVVRLENLSRLHTGLLLLEDQVPWQLGRPQRFVVDQLVGGSRRDVRYQLRAPLRGRYDVGPLHVQLVDPFGLCRMTRRFAVSDSLTVVPNVVPLPPVPLQGDWSGLGESRNRSVASTGEDDVVPRQYRTGDELRRVHWKSTARSGELMVRQEEQPWRTARPCCWTPAPSRTAATGRPRRSSGRSLSPRACRATCRSVATPCACSTWTASRCGATPTSRSTACRPWTRRHRPSMPSPSYAPRTARCPPSPTRGRGTARATASSWPCWPTSSRRSRSCSAGCAGRATAIAVIADVSRWPGPRAMPADEARLTRSVAVLRTAGWRVAVCGPGDDLGTAWRGVARGHGSLVAHLRHA